MGFKQEKEVSREELAAFLESLADGLRQGKVELAGERWKVPKTIRAKIRLKDKKGSFKTKVSWQWSSLADYTDVERQAVEQWKKSLKASKKCMGATFKALQRTVGNGGIPSSAQLAAFEESTREFAEFAEPEWQDAMDEFNDHLSNLARAVNAEDEEGIRHELRDLQARMVACHRLYK